MAHYTTQAGLDDITGALTKNKRHRRLTVTRIKHHQEPIPSAFHGDVQSLERASCRSRTT